ncbi:MAG: hypothetical protein Kow0063_21640 [Anaerolineae bacterium]
MKPTLSTRLMMVIWALTTLVGLPVLVACSPAPVTTSPPAVPTATPRVVAPTSSPQIVLPLVTGGDATSETGMPSALPTRPLSVETATATGQAVISPLPSPTPGADGLSPGGRGLPPGSSAPDFTLESAQGGRITLSDYRDRSSVVLVFYRGQT